MRCVTPAAGWPKSWQSSYQYDLLEIYGSCKHRGYSYAYDVRRRQTLHLVTEALPAGASILDVAAAQGNFSLALAEQGYRVTWNDLRAELVNYVKLKHVSGSIEYAPGNAFELAFPVPFDAVLATEVIEHVAHPEEFLARLASLVRPGGYIVLTTPNGAYFRNRLPSLEQLGDRSALEGIQFQPDADGHLFLLHPRELEAMAAQAGLTVERLILFTNPLTAGHVKLEPLLRMLPRPAVDALETLSQRVPQGLRTRFLHSIGARLRVD
jgi:2-polyprenyl-6-hydroxyphenyl methylase/3-demethylubiquinone-9 3-methyltransferase